MQVNLYSPLILELTSTRKEHLTLISGDCLNRGFTHQDHGSTEFFSDEVSDEKKFETCHKKYWNTER